MADQDSPGIVWEVLDYVRTTDRHQKMALLELAFLQESFGEGFRLSNALIREQVRFPQRDKRFRRVVQELVREGYVECDQDQRCRILRTWVARE